MVYYALYVREYCCRHVDNTPQFRPEGWQGRAHCTSTCTFQPLTQHIAYEPYIYTLTES